ncbi:hypothetical protein GCM10023107_00700 [Actinoplanes octamycinicus]|uniref:AMP-binding enzyme n=1 Tax=Actinoplanes octamycinicus TaxID=135948 RepID=UPI00337125B4
MIGLPLPPGCLPTLWQDDERYVRSYLTTFQGNYLTGDGGRFDEDGYLYVLGRTDDVINVAGHRLSTGAMEEVLAGHPAVAECAVIGVHDALKGQSPRAFVVLKAGADPDGVAEELIARVRAQIGRSPPCAGWTWSRPCRRPAPARSCAAPCGASRTPATPRSRPPSRTRRCWRPCVRCCVRGAAGQCDPSLIAPTNRSRKVFIGQTGASVAA